MRATTSGAPNEPWNAIGPRDNGECGMDASMISEMKSMADEHKRFKKMFAELSVQNDLLKEALGKSKSAIH